MKRGILALALLGSLAACGSDTSKAEADKLDAQLTGKDAAKDPAITAALEDQIMVDPALVGQSNANAARPADAPLQGPVPPGEGVSPRASGPAPATLGERAAAQTVADKRNFNGCGLDVDYGLSWANRLPPELPLYPQARVEEAAGSDLGKCRLRAVTFSTGAAPQALADFYLSAARKAGFTASQTRGDGEDMVGGTRSSDGAAFYVVLAERKGGGTVVDIVANNGV